ncbi:MAG: hypothetical protein AB9856_07430 [Cellulosilyticaceae bacterium]
MSAVFNLGSLILGLISWLAPIVGIGLTNKDNVRLRLSVISFSACAVSLVLQIFEIKNRVFLNDFGAIMDTINAVCSESVILVIITIILNLILLKKFHIK